MKNRNGFVSNSSSASFIVTWKHNGYDDLDGSDNPDNLITDVSEAVNRILMYAPDNVLSDIVDNTEHLGNGVFQTMCRTYMMNSIVDFDANICYLVTALVANQYGQFELVKTEVRDGF